MSSLSNVAFDFKTCFYFSVDKKKRELTPSVFNIYPNAKWSRTR